jgi:hypothetical protein
MSVPPIVTLAALILDAIWPGRSWGAHSTIDALALIGLWMAVVFGAGENAGFRALVSDWVLAVGPRRKGKGDA